MVEKNKINSKPITRFIVLQLIVIIVLSSGVFAFGVSKPYWDSNPLVIEEGIESENVVLYLQNMVGNEDMILKAEIVDGDEIATLIDENLEYSVPFGREDVPVNLLITLPENSVAGEVREVEVSFKQITTTDEDAFLQIAGEVSAKFPVVIVEAQETPSLAPEGSGFLIVLVVVILALAVIVVVYRKNRSVQQSNVSRDMKRRENL